MDDARTVWVGNIADQVTEELLYELFLQAGPLERVKIPSDREGRKSNFGFITFKHEVSVPYTVQLLNGIRLFEKNLNIKPRNGGAQNRQNVQQNPMQRSFSYPNDAYNAAQQQNEHMRFDDHGEMGPPHVSYEDLMRMGHTINVNYNNYPENSYGNDYSNNFGHNRHQSERSNIRERLGDRERDRREYDRSRNEHDRDRDRHHDYSNNRNQRKNHDKRNNYDNRNSGRRNHRHY